MSLLGYLRWITFSLFLFTSPTAFSTTITDSLGNPFTLDTPPQRIVTLEYAFADALAAIDLSPVGIADDNDPLNLHPAVVAKLQGWVSVGDRATPNLEKITALKPDLIIADVNRHQAMYAALSQIAPTVLLASRGETYQENLDVALKIGDIAGHSEVMQARLLQHQNIMQGAADALSDYQGRSVLFAVASENGLYAYSGAAYPGGVLKALKLTVPEKVGEEDRALRQLTFDDITSMDPDILLSGHLQPDSLLNQWQQQPAWQSLKAVSSGQLIEVDSNHWANCRGLLASEAMANNLLQALAVTPEPPFEILPSERDLGIEPE
ncbi:Fe(3+) dicitrate ABC transporter substrate-binding protein [Photobacterium sp. TLY01]|uniref:Fe(3+) dicitrate ABC transporter substrate-binding protein n=1 Tax=Photobacterium sp. TLY01 TaxID=2907534 RepID=UPI001EEB6DF6|nr:Fe(3+) dicitrate ABC transporter substrate-binding protein [Photobacterium sp. TLY01]UIP28818.1 ABC transporter substrate-binding protein [Photobacterium sp. TLY01]